MRLPGVALLSLCALCAGGVGRARAAPLTLAAAVQTAREHHPNVRAAEAAWREGRARAGVALAGYLPAIGLTALGRGDLSNFTPVVVGTPTSGTASTTFPFEGSLRYSASANLVQLLFDGGRTLGELGAARARALAAEQDLAAERIAIEGQVTSAYFGVLEGAALVTVALDYEAQMRAQLESARRLIGAGVRPEFDAISAETRAQRATLDRIRAEGTSLTRRAALVAAIGLERDEGYELADAFTAQLPEEGDPLEALVGRALAARPDLRALEATRGAVAQQVRSARSDYFPRMSLGLAGTMTGTNELPRPLFDFFATLNFSQDIFSGLSTYRGVQAMRAALAGVEARIVALRVQVRAAIASSLAALSAARLADRQAELLVEQADKLVKSAQKRYDAGLLTMLELFDAQSQRALARGQRVSARYALALARAELRRAIGGTILDGEVAR